MKSSQVSGNGDLCKKCINGLIANESRNKCIKCDKGLYSEFDKKCVNCPDFTSLSHKQSGCNILDIVHNKAYQMRFYLKGLKKTIKTIAESCKDQNEFCNDKFVGPVRDHNRNGIFFISFAEKGNLKYNEIQ